MVHFRFTGERSHKLRAWSRGRGVGRLPSSFGRMSAVGARHGISMVDHDRSAVASFAVTANDMMHSTVWCVPEGRKMPLGNRSSSDRRHPHVLALLRQPCGRSPVNFSSCMHTMRLTLTDGITNDHASLASAEKIRLISWILNNLTSQLVDSVQIRSLAAPPQPCRDRTSPSRPECEQKRTAPSKVAAQCQWAATCRSSRPFSLTATVIGCTSTKVRPTAKSVT